MRWSATVHGDRISCAAIGAAKVLTEPAQLRTYECDGLAHYRAPEAGAAASGDRGPAGRQALVVGYGSPPEHAFSHALARLCAALNDPA